jgi:hypothetical protein
MSEECSEVSVVKDVIDSFRDELDDYRDEINQNTNEIQSCFEFLLAMQKKLDWLAERVDDISRQSSVPVKKDFVFAPLTQKEKELFFVLYRLSESSFVTYRQLSRELKWSETLASSYVTNMIGKGVPIVKKYEGTVVFVQLDRQFRELQAKTNVVGVDSRLTYWMS